ncbi:hypothetical protein Pmar_PMAR021029 [Perkinsus marinus ATCC 50983]|uniref:Polymerase nucleotidyl transferase domain-containing protein n=1 Tax=Perkinsus marinus (strain ATCC 50983 / TXsc) TaxID=423536 RepID=C5KG77_PERM5|nr:hypothetical protein Pmar_PMAR021029 [Perkinsus marinus ATCC 50983]EER16433.1 hypothetical protein Pmar_PMAR021029 [Perkinsus marinus ATCC 50983]|eukprot:XP_002784637.1 hypothetical protein Pmar_PMAR021029 [Perkinsus marinus ATCC 50983]
MKRKLLAARTTDPEKGEEGGRICITIIIGITVITVGDEGPHTPPFEPRELTKEDRTEVENTIKVRLGMLPTPAHCEEKEDSSISSSSSSTLHGKSPSRSPSPESTTAAAPVATESDDQSSHDKGDSSGRDDSLRSSRQNSMEPPKGRGGRQESSRGRVEDGRVSLAETEEESSVDTGESEDVPSTVERGGSGQEDDSGSGLEEGTPMADPLLHGTARAETDSVADRVTVDVGLFMHFVDSYSVSGDNLKRITLSNEIEHALASFHPYHLAHCRIKTIVFGSYAYNLHLPWASDLDFVLIPTRSNRRRNSGDGGSSPSSVSSSMCGGNHNPEITCTPEERLKLLYLVAQHLERRLGQGTIGERVGVLVNTPVVIASSRIPLLTLQCKGPAQSAAEKKWCSTCEGGFGECCPLHSSVKVQISVTGPAHSGIETSAYVAMLCQHYDCLRPLVLVIKHVLVCDGLVTPYDGGMSSYTLVLMVVSFLNQFYGNNASHQNVSLGQLLLGMLYWYGGEEDPCVEEAHLEGGRQFLDKVNLILSDGTCMRSFSASRLAIRPVAAETHSHFCERSEDPILASRFATDMMVILDPLALNGDYVNLGQSVWRWPAVAAAFRCARRSFECGGWWGQKYGLATPPVWVAARRAGFPSPTLSGVNEPRASATSIHTEDTARKTEATGPSSVSTVG